MPKCIYCLRNHTLTNFNFREHIIPSSMGSFVPLNPTIKGDVVCDFCNTKTFNPLETNFIEDTYEGITAQRLNFNDRNSITIRNKNFKIEKAWGFGDSFLNKMFFFLKWENGRLVADLKRQIQLKNYKGGYRVFLPETLRKIKKDSRKFKRMSRDLQKLSNKDIMIFAESNNAIKDIIALLHSFDVKYEEKQTKSRFLQPGEEFKLREDYNCKITKNIGRVIAKIAFNYFAYCAIQDGLKHILYKSEFDKIRNFVYSGKGSELKEIIPSIKEKPILLEERIKKKRLIAHLITFLKEQEQIVVRMTFFGLPPIYKIILGRAPKALDHDQFGCGHAFNPFTGRIYNLSQRQPPKNPTGNEVRLSFGLFKRA